MNREKRERESHHQKRTATNEKEKCDFVSARFIKIDFGIFAFFVRISFALVFVVVSLFAVYLKRSKREKRAKPLDAGIDFILFSISFNCHHILSSFDFHAHLSLGSSGDSIGETKQRNCEKIKNILMMNV
jgi:hypothetical protein